MSRDLERTVRFHEIRGEKFPLRILTFSPAGELNWDSGLIERACVVEVPGTGPGSCRYNVMVFGDGTAELRDDPSCGGTVDVNLSVEELAGKMAHLVEIVQESGRLMIEETANALDLVEQLGDHPIRKYFELQADVGEKMVMAAALTRELLQEARDERG